MNKHTKEPWILRDGDDMECEKVITTKIRDNTHVIPIVQIETDWTGKVGIEQKENARRIIACVNACAGIETDKLEAVAFLYPHLPAGLKDSAIEYSEIKSQRDELIAAIKQTLDENGHLADGDVCTLKVLKDVIAKVEASA